MDIETSEAIETLRADVRRVETTLGARIDLLAAGLDTTGSSLRAEMGQLHAEMGEMRTEMGEVRGEMVSMREELMRHSQVLYESLRDDIRMIAEGLVTLDRKVESLRPPGRP